MCRLPGVSLHFALYLLLTRRFGLYTNHCQRDLKIESEHVAIQDAPATAGRGASTAQLPCATRLDADAEPPKANEQYDHGACSSHRLHNAGNSH